MGRQEIVFQEAQTTDAKSLVDFINQVTLETDFLVMEDQKFSYSLEQTQEILEWSASVPEQLCLLAKLEDRIVGLINVQTARSYQVSHIGGVFIAVLKDYWGHGIGKILLEEVVAWAEEVGMLSRLELTVQMRNERAVRLYQSCGFEIEGIQRRGVRTDEGEWLDLYYMGRLID